MSNPNGSRLNHGDARKGKATRMYRIFRGVVQRCDDANAPIYQYYGARGIRCEWVCYEDFKRDMGPTYQDHLTLGRIDNDGNYCKQNCRWETRAQQARNYRRNVFLTYKGETKPMCDWAAQIGMDPKTFQQRLRKLKWPIERIMTEPSQQQPRYSANGRTQTIPQWAEELGVTDKCIYRRLKLGWPLEKALTVSAKRVTPIR